MVFILPMRLFSSSAILRGANAVVNKSLLAQLRKSTGYSISHCKKALVQHDNDVDKVMPGVISYHFVVIYIKIIEQFFFHFVINIETFHKFVKLKIYLYRSYIAYIVKEYFPFSMPKI